jgi:hypothetical protein
MPREVGRLQERRNRERITSPATHQALRTRAHSKTLTFTLSTTTP